MLKSNRGGPRTPGPGKRIGAVPKPIAELKPVYGKVRVRIDPATQMVIPVDAETRLIAQQLMLREWPGVTSVEQLFAYAVRRLAEDQPGSPH